MNSRSQSPAVPATPVVALAAAVLLLAALPVHAQMTTIVAETFGGSGGALNGRTATIVTPAILNAGGSGLWIAHTNFLDNGTVLTNPPSVTNATVGRCAGLNLGNYINNARNTSTGYFELTLTMSPTLGTNGWLSLGFAQENTVNTNKNFTDSPAGTPTETGNATVIYRGSNHPNPAQASKLDLFGGTKSANAVAGGPVTAGNQTLTVALDLTPAGGYNGVNNFGKVTWKANGAVIGSFTYTTTRTWGKLLISQANGNSGTVSALTLAQTAAGSGGTTVSVKADNTDALNLASSWVGGSSPFNTTNIALWDATVQSPNTVVLGADTTWGGISISNPAGPVTIDAGHALTLGNEPVDIDLSRATADLILNCPLVLGAHHVWDVTNARTLTVAGALSGSFNLNKRGQGAAILAAANTHAGTNTISGGTLALSGPGTLGNAANSLVLAGGQLDLGGSSQTLGDVSITVAPLSGQTIGNGSLAGTSYAASLTSGNAILAANLLANGAAGFTKSGSGGAVTLLGDNTYAGPTIVGGGGDGALTLGHSNALGSTAAGTTVSNGNTLKLQGGLTFAAEPLALVTGSSTTPLLQSVGGDNTWTGPMDTLGSGLYARISSDTNLLLTLANTVSGNDPLASLVLQGAGGILVSGKITGPSALISSSVGAGTRTLSNPSNDFSGNVNLNGGTLRLGAAEVIPDGPGKGGVVFNASATLDLSGFTETINGLTGTNNGVVDNTAAGTTAVLRVGGNDQTSRYSGVLRNTGGTLALTKIGSGTLTLSGTNTSTGNTVVSAGTLLVNGALGSGPVTVQAGATLGGSGTLAGETTLETGSILSPGVGTNAGRLSVGQYLLVLSGATVAIQLNGPNVGAYDQIAPAFDYFLQEPTLAITLGYTPAPGDQYTIVDGSFFSFPDGRFAGLTNGATFSAGGHRFVINYASGDGTDVVLVCQGADLAAPVLGAPALVGTNLLVSVPSVSGASYVLQSTTSLTPPILWNNESTNAGTGGSLLLPVPIEPGQPRKFLRFRVY